MYNHNLLSCIINSCISFLYTFVPKFEMTCELMRGVLCSLTVTASLEGGEVLRLQCLPNACPHFYLFIFEPYDLYSTYI